MSERIGVITRFLKRKVAIRRDGENFAIAFLPENTVVSRMQKQERSRSRAFSPLGGCE